MKIAAIELPMENIAEFCHKWKVIEFALFGSVLRDDFRPDSDIDRLVHEYNDVNLNIVWDVVQFEIPPLITETLSLDETVTISLNQLTCHEPGCPPIETAIVIMEEAPKQYKIHKSIAEIEQLIE